MRRILHDALWGMVLLTTCWSSSKWFGQPSTRLMQKSEPAMACSGNADMTASTPEQRVTPKTAINYNVQFQDPQAGRFVNNAVDTIGVQRKTLAPLQVQVASGQKTNQQTLDLDQHDGPIDATCDATVQGAVAPNERAPYPVAMFWRKSLANRASFDPWTVTLTTQLGVNRLARLLGLVQRWRGPVSAAVLVCSQRDVQTVEAWYRVNHRELQPFLDLHVAIAPSDPYPINFMRNLARNGVAFQNGLEAVVDVDAFLGQDMGAVSQDVRNAVDQDGFRGEDGLGGGIVFCLSAFELAKSTRAKPPLDAGIASSQDEFSSSSSSSSSYPTSIGQLEDMFRAKLIRPMHQGRRSYSGPFRHSEWLFGPRHAQAVPYEVYFEPYFVVRSKPPPTLPRIAFPEHFRGRGFNKQALHFHMFAAGYTHASLASSFVVDMAHESSSWTSSSLGIQENQAEWVSFRTWVAKHFQLECLEDDWKRCDHRTVGCHRVCHQARARKRKKTTNSNQSSHSTRWSDGTGPSATATATATATKENVHWRLYKAALQARSAAGKRRAQPFGEPNLSCFTQGQDGAQMTPHIDLVFTWVNGSDPAHIAQQRRFIPQSAFQAKLDLGQGRKVRTNNDLAFRFRDWGRASTLRYSLRSIRQFAPWVRKIWIVTADQTPSWMDVERAKEKGVEFVSHQTIFRQTADASKCLPTFNSCAIESQIHRIPGLANCYLYLNDDFFLVKELGLHDLFEQQRDRGTAQSATASGTAAAAAPTTTYGLPKVFLTGERAPRIGRDPWQAKIAAVGQMIHDKLDVRWEHLFSVGHHGFLFVKPVVERLIDDVFKKEFEQTAAERWRAQTSAWLPFVYMNYFAWNYEVGPQIANAFYFSMTTEGGGSAVAQAFDRIDKGSFQWACFNDLAVHATQDISDQLVVGFERLFPNALPFEKNV